MRNFGGMLARVVHIIVILAAVTLAGCGDNAVQRRLDHAAALVESDPAAALAVCDSIADPSALPAAQKALYGYVDALAGAILGEDKPDDSLLDFAIGYYTSEPHRDSRRTTKCLFAKAQNLAGRRNFGEAVVCSAEALLFANEVRDQVWRARIYRQMADISGEFLNFPQAIEFSDSSIIAFERAGLAEQAQYQRISRAQYLSASGQPERAIIYLDSVFSADAEFYGGNGQYYYAAMADACSRAQHIDRAMGYLLQIDSAAYTSPPYDLLQAAAVTMAATGRYRECDSIMSLYCSLTRDLEPLERNLNYQAMAYAVDRYRGNIDSALRHLENCVDKTASLQNMENGAMVMNYQALLEREEAKVREQRSRTVLAVGVCTSITLIFLLLVLIIRLTARHQLKIKEDDAIISRHEAMILSLRQKISDAAKPQSDKSVLLLNSLVKEYSNGNTTRNTADASRFDSAVRQVFSTSIYNDIEKDIDRQLSGVVSELEQIGINAGDIKILVLTKWGMNVSTIATVVRLTPHAVTVRRSRARAKIKQSASERKDEISAFFWG